MSRFILHTKAREKEKLRYLMMGLAGLIAAAAVGYVVHSIGTVRAKGRETVLIYTEEEFEQYLLDTGSEEYNLNGRYQLEADLDLSWLETSIGSNIEPFTGSFDGNGHVISGLERPLFGVLREAKVEHLFLSESMIQNPFTYSDGEHYVDGYASLAAYAVDSSVKNCGMSGEIHTASPSEAEYHLAKATPADAEERKGPGFEEVVVPSFAEETMEAHQTEAGKSEVTPGDGTESAEGGGPGVETLESTETETRPTEDGGPGSETGETTATGNGGSTSSVDEEYTTDGNDGSTAPGGEESTAGGNEGSTIPGGEESTAGGNEGSIIPGGGEESTADRNEESTTSGNEGSATDRSEESTTPGNEGSITEGNEESIEAGNKESTADSHTENAEAENKENNMVGVSAISEKEGSPAGGSGGSSYDNHGKHPVDGNEKTPTETVGYQALVRHQLMLKIPTVTEGNAETIRMASPPDATPEDADKESEDTPTISAENEDPKLEYTGSPDGDIYILVTAERITAGGLIAQAEGDTRIADCFTLVAISSDVDEFETYAGGMTGINGRETWIENSYASGIVDSSGITGGFTACHSGTIQNSYSTMTVGKRGNTRGAFLAEGEGRLSGCVYDRQIVGIEETNGLDGSLEEVWPDQEYETGNASEAEPEFSLRGLNTIQMTGQEPDVPGTWYTTDGAYPQLETFAQSSQETVLSYSRASAIALILPEGSTLLDVLEGSNIVLPSGIDGQEIQWDAEGNAAIDENNQIKIGTTASVSRNEIPKVEAALGSVGEGMTADGNVENIDKGDTEAEVKETEVTDIETSNIRLKASIGNAGRTFTLTAGEEVPADVPANWGEVGKELYDAGNRPFAGTGSQSDPYLIGTAEELAIFAHMVNLGNRNLCARLTANIDLFGSEHTNVTYDPAAPDIDAALLWSPIAGYRGTFDGAGHYVFNLRIAGTGNQGFMSGMTTGGVIQDFGIESGKITGNGENTGSMVGEMSGSNTKILRCWNRADIEGGTRCTGGIAGGGRGSGGSGLIDRCYNMGTVTASSGYEIGGILGFTTISLAVRNCYNEGRIIGNAGTVGGVIGFINIGSMANCYNVGEVVGGYGIIGRGGASNCYYLESCTASGSNGRGTALPELQMKSWALAYALNGQSMTGAWKYKPGEYPKFGDLDRPDSWQDIGKGINNGLITGYSMTSGSNGYEIQSVEQLAAFAAKVNDGETGASAMLMSNLDLTGTKYSGTQENPISWIPIGTGELADSVTNIYTGTFDGNGKIIGGMKINVDGYAGLFGCAGGGALIKKTGLDMTCSIEAISPGTSGLDGTAAFVGAVRHTGSAATQLTIEHCYTRASIQGKSIHTGSFLGRDESTAGENRITNCYATGEIATSLGSVKPGAIAGTFANGTGSAGTLMYCYWDEGVESHYSGGLTIVGQGSQTAADSGKQQAGYMKTDPFLNKMNTGLSTAIWERDDSKNNGYPVFSGLTVYTNWEGVGAVAAEPAATSAGTKGTASNPYLIKAAEDLAWFAYQVNVNGKTEICGKLMADISLFGGLYTGGNGYDSNDNEILSRALLWVPAGSDTAGKRYTGTFDGNGHVISKMRVKGTEKQGLFGTLGTSADIRKTSVTTSLMEVDSAYAGGIAGYVNGTGVTVTECGNRGNLTGKGDFFGGVVGGIETGGNLVLDGCYNGMGGIIITSGVYAGGVLGGAGSGTVTIRNCYNRGKVEGQSYAGGIAGWIANNDQTIANSYNAGQITGTGGRFQSITGSNSGTGNITNCYYQTGCPADPSAEEVSEAGLKTWGAAFVLNGEQLGQPAGISWSYTEGDYPVPSQTSLRDASSWEEVGEAAYYGLLDGAVPALSGMSYQIGNAEQLAWFAYRVNNVAGDTAIQADLTADIDMAATENRYISGGAGDRLGWMPIGKEFACYFRGTFGEGHQRIYEIRNLYVNRNYYAGLFGNIRENARIMRTGLAGCKVSAWGISSNQYAGGIAGYVDDNAVLSQCYNVSGGEVTGGGTDKNVYPAAGGIIGTLRDKAVLSQCYSSGCTIRADGANHGIGGGITGSMGDRARLEDSYVLDSAVATSGIYGGAAGGIAGSVTHTAVVSNSYSACGTAGSVTVSTGTRFGGIAGEFSVGAVPDTGMKNCYSEELLGKDESHGVKKLGTTDAARQSDVDSLNTTESGKRTGTARVWYTSLNPEETRGLPTFTAPETVAVEFVTDTPEAGSRVSLPGNLSVADMKLRSFGAVDSTFTPGSTAASGDGITLTACTDLTGADSNYHKYGYTDANQKLAFKAGGKDLMGLAGSLNNPTTDLGTVSSVSLGRAAAYTKPEDRYVLLEGASGTDRYEIQITVKGITSKTLSVTMPVEVTMAQLTPDGTDHVDYSTALNIKNNNAYPIDGKIVSATPRSGNGYVPLKPVLGTLPKNREITDTSGGVRLGLANQSGSSTPLAANIYYDPDAVASGKSWLEYRLKNGGILPYRYVMEYSGLHFSGAVDRFAYDISYEFAVSESNYTDTADVIVTP